MFFEDNSKPSKSTRSKKKIENENKIIQSSQGGKIKLLKSKDLVAGTYDEDDDVIEIPDSPQPVTKQPKTSIFSRKPKESAEDLDFCAPSAGTSRGSALKTLEDNKTVKQKDPEKKIVKESVVKNIKKSPAKNTRKSKSPARNASLPTEIVLESPTRATKKSSIKKNLPLPTSIFKRGIESDSDDDFSFFENSVAKKSKMDNQSTQKSQKLQSQQNCFASTSKNATISKQLKTSQSSAQKRPHDETQDDLFEFENKKVKKNEPKLRRNQKVSESTSSSVASVKTAISNQRISSDIPSDLEPGRDYESTGWLSKDSLVGIKKEEPYSENEESTSSTVPNNSETVFRVVPSESNFNETSEVRGKTFRKKINYKPQTATIKTRDLNIDDANFLYPMAL